MQKRALVCGALAHWHSAHDKSVASARLPPPFGPLLCAQFGRFFPRAQHFALVPARLRFARRLRRSDLAHWQLCAVRLELHWASCQCALRKRPKGAIFAPDTQTHRRTDAQTHK